MNHKEDRLILTFKYKKMFIKQQKIESAIYWPPKVRTKKSNDWEVGIFMAK